MQGKGHHKTLYCEEDSLTKRGCRGNELNNMGLHAVFPDMFWAEVVNHACYLVNQSPSSVLGFNCVEKVWSSKPVNYSKLRVFSCCTYAHFLSDESTKVKPKSLKCIFIDFEKGMKGYKLWDLVNKKVLSRDNKMGHGRKST